MELHVDDSSAGELRASLDAILDSDGFKNAPQLQNFLKYVVEETLAGRGDQLSGYSIGTEALQRSEDFNPEIDSIVRTLAVRLRRSLDHYYATEGKGDLFRIRIPKGQYMPHFAVNAGSLPPLAGAEKKASGVSWPMKVLFGICAAMLMLQFSDLLLEWQAERERGDLLRGSDLTITGTLSVPTIEVPQFRRGAGWDGPSAFSYSGFGDALPAEIAALLVESGKLRVVSRLYDTGSSHQRASNSHDNVFELYGVVNKKEGGLMLNLGLVHTGTREKVWTYRMALDGDGEIGTSQAEKLTSHIVEAISKWQRPRDNPRGGALTLGGFVTACNG